MYASKLRKNVVQPYIKDRRVKPYLVKNGWKINSLFRKKHGWPNSFHCGVSMARFQGE